MTKTNFETEQTEQSLPPARMGGTQTLVPGVRPVTVEDRLKCLADAPLAPRKEQKPLNIGLFDEDSRNQLDLLTHSHPETT